MRKTHMVVASALIAALVPSAIASARTSATAAGSKTVGLHHTRLGSILVAPNGFTLYEFTRDHKNTNACQHISECPSFWPALTSTVHAGHGVNAKLLGAIRLKNGKHQVTYAGHALYMYSGDSGPAETSYVGVEAFGGHWYALNAKGGTVR